MNSDNGSSFVMRVIFLTGTVVSLVMAGTRTSGLEALLMIVTGFGCLIGSHALFYQAGRDEGEKIMSERKI